MISETIKTNLYIGFNDKDKHYQVYSDEIMLNTIMDILDTYVECYTIQKVTGVYKGEAETSCIVTVCSNAIYYINIKSLVDELKEALNQEAIYVEQSIINGGLL